MDYECEYPLLVDTLATLVGPPADGMECDTRTMAQRYIPDGYYPHAEPMKETVPDATMELIYAGLSSPVTDFPLFSEIIGGFRPNEFTILCGSTGTGKTTLVANWSASWLKQGIPHFVASVETGRTDYVKRVMSVLADEDLNTGDRIPYERVKTIRLEHEHLLLTDLIQLSRYEDRFSVETLMADIAWMVENKGIKIAIVDNLNFFLEVRRSNDLIVEMDRVVHDLIIFSKNVPVHIIMIMHPKKTDSGRVETELDIKGSSTAVQEAYNILLFNRLDENTMNRPGYGRFNREIKIAKLRRRGCAVGARLILETKNGVRYMEKALL